MINTFNKITISVNIYFNYRNYLDKGVGANPNFVVDYSEHLCNCPKELKIAVAWLVGGLVVLGVLRMLTKGKKGKKADKKEPSAT
jgi:hypothetical protein